ncbi:hypothetical protein CYMTET_45374 [Cymbomonas tetramitiformis]|uniref:Uncharacterized protein n=1 Tax=Cymbomonas tetramitiformis TaxID=36881 RepID=A0AAE0C054_9CHLO|nr:hypothetical protein CYMTET_45374 [Cymbomonas tetramitiformis]
MSGKKMRQMQYCNAVVQSCSVKKKKPVRPLNPKALGLLCGARPQDQKRLIRDLLLAHIRTREECRGARNGVGKALLRMHLERLLRDRGEAPMNGTPGQPSTGGKTGDAQGTQGASDDDAMREATSADAGPPFAKNKGWCYCRFVGKGGILDVDIAGAGRLQTYNVVITAADYPALCALSGEKDLMELGVKALRNNVFNDETKEEQRQPYALFNVDTRKWKELHNGLWLCTQHDPECAAGESGGKCRACKYKENRNANRQPVDAINGLEDYPLDKSLKLLPKKWVSPDLRDGEKPPQRHLLVPKNKIFGRNSKYSGKMTPGGAALMVICILHEPKCIVKKFVKKAYQLMVDDDAAQKGYASCRLPRL